MGGVLTADWGRLRGAEPTSLSLRDGSRTYTTYMPSDSRLHMAFTNKNTVKSFYFIGMKFCGLTMMDMFLWTLEFQIIHSITKLNKFFVGILNSWIALPMKNTKLNVQRIKVISHYHVRTAATVQKKCSTFYVRIQSAN